MNENNNTGATSRKSLRNLSNPLELRELNRQIEWIWKKLLGGLDVKSFSDGGVKTVVNTVEKVVADDLRASEITTNVLKAALSEMMVAEIGVADIDYAHIVDLMTETAIITQGEAGELFIARLAVTDENVVSLNADVITSGTLATDRLILTGANGLIYEINATSSGLTAAQLTKEEYQHQINGSVIIAKSITADQMAANSITGDKILAGSIKTAHLDAHSVDATKMVAHTLSVNEVTSDFGQQLDLSSNTSISSIVQSIDTLTGRTAAAEQWITPHSILMIVSDGENHNHLELDNTGLAINGGVFSVNVTGSDGDTTFDEEGLTVPVINSPSVPNRYYGYGILTIDAAATEDQLKTGLFFRGVSDAMYMLDNLIIDQVIQINIVGTYYEDVQLIGTLGSGAIIFNGGTIAGDVSVHGCSTLVRFNGVTFISKYTTSDNGNELFLERNSYVEILDCDFMGACKNSICANQIPNLIVNSCTFFGSQNNVYFSSCANVNLNRNRGVSVISAYVGDESVAFMSGTRPEGAITGQFNGSLLLGSASVDNNVTDVPVTSQTITQTFTCTASNTYRGGWRGSGDVWQGYQSGRNYGCYWFAGLETAISGKTIVTANLKLRRMTGYGSGSRAEVSVYGCGNSSASGTISVLAGGNSGSVNQGEFKAITLSNAAVQSIADGTGHGLVLDTGETGASGGKSYSFNYARFNGIGSNYVPVLTVTYK